MYNKWRRVQALPGRGPGLNIDFRPLSAQVLSGLKFFMGIDIFIFIF